MTQWIMAHPWMTFFIVIVGLLILDSIIANICNCVQRIKQTRILKDGAVEQTKIEAANKEADHGDERYL